MPFPFGPDVLADDVGDLFIGSSAAEQILHINLSEREEAIAQFAVGGEANAVAAHAERPGDGPDDADPAAAISVLPILGWVARVFVGGDRWRSEPSVQL